MQFYDLLKHQSLFQGMSGDDLSNVIAYMYFGFEKISTNAVIASPKMPCKKLLMITSGTVSVETVSGDGRLRVNEQVSAPYAIEPERLFGINQHFSHTYKASAKCHVLSLPKADVMKLVSNLLIFRINLLNHLSTLSQRRMDFPWIMMPKTDEQRLRNFFLQHVVSRVGEKVFRIRMTDLATYLGISRLDLSKILNNLDSRKIIILQRGMITIPDMSLLASSDFPDNPV